MAKRKLDIEYLTGYLHNVSTVTLSANVKTKYFTGSFQMTKTDTMRLVCFAPGKHEKFVSTATMNSFVKLTGSTLSPGRSVQVDAIYNKSTTLQVAMNELSFKKQKIKPIDESQPKDLINLSANITRDDHSQRCTVCVNRQKTAVIIPCGHTFCMACATQIEALDQPCPTQQHLDFSCTQSGFHVSNENPFLGASPDGITNCQCCGRGIVEIKCPYKHKDNTIEHAAAIDSTFCLDKNLHLKTNHRYYTQIQFQMYILKVTYCDFVVFTKCKPLPSLVIIRVLIDINLCNSMIAKCNRFIQDYVVKELITRDLENQPATTSSTQDDKNNVTETWCLCFEPEYGRMIKSENLDCPYQWFHYKCVNIRRKPRGKWYCLNCEK
ncbi:unnamed protein product [Mytilus edulis]|uniref:RING-type domain-containing protein n=1 Tax=Mytilus edulis TaxID=6550 RepID=A0A8S3TH78_MYTED|nr:unnamed protein product [Mytilus edulis]